LTASRFSPRPAIALSGTLLALAALACHLDIGGPEPPGPPIPVSTEAANELQHIWQSVVAGAAGGEIALIIDERQLTSLLAMQLQTHEKPLMREPQVFLRQGFLQLYGVTDRGPFRATFLLAIQPVIDANGDLEFEITSADFGPLLAPQGLKSALSTILTEALTGTLGSFASGIRISSIAIVDGQMAIIARVR
jgi:hypothetical protein